MSIRTNVSPARSKLQFISLDHQRSVVSINEVVGANEDPELTKSSPNKIARPNMQIFFHRYGQPRSPNTFFQIIAKIGRRYHATLMVCSKLCIEVGSLNFASIVLVRI